MTPKELMTPPTVIEEAAFLNDENMLPLGKNVLRRLLFQRNELIEEVERIREHYNSVIRFAIDDEEARAFLQVWEIGDWETLEREWPEFKIPEWIKRKEHQNYEN